MPSERHIRRQIQWSEKLREYGCEVSLETPIRIKGARVIPDVLAKTNGKTFLIEIGNIEDERKSALMKIFAETNPNYEFIHEPYGVDKMNVVLDSLDTYRNSEEYKILRRQKYVKLLKNTKKEKRNTSIRLSSFFIAFFSFILIFVLSSSAYDLYEILAIPLWGIMLISGFIFLKPFLDLFSGTLRIPAQLQVNEDELRLDYSCPWCRQPCTKIEFENGSCMYCSQTSYSQNG